MKDTNTTCTELIALAREKYLIDKKRNEAKYLDLKWMLDEIIAEVEEVRAEIKERNSVFLEDELGDILWGIVVAAVRLEKMEYITSAEKIVERALQKYTERIAPLEGNISDDEHWERVKQQQKIALRKENDLRHKKD
jgi:hypothetical protein